ncbi:MAG TPA: TIM barrel protein [Egibacteraceae bacterium]|nr:TIM barrel protein [Egibacteraceae bacterium]
MDGILQRTAGAPISWGICEVPGWGLQLPAERVLRDMAELGLRATELGADGFLPDDPAALRAMLDRYRLRLVGGFVPLVLHDRDAASQTMAAAARALALLSAAGADCFVTAAVTDLDWSPRTPLDDPAWRQLADTLARVEELVASAGLRHVLHPHAGTVVQNADEIWRVLEDTQVSWCLDTGHLAIGGVDPVEFAQAAAGRIGHVHLKDAHTALCRRVQSGELSLLEATRRGMFQPLGRGDLAIDRTVAALETAGYPGWYVLEQDIALDAGASATTADPRSDVRDSLTYLRSVMATGGDMSTTSA